MKNFAIIGVGGYVAPRHLAAIKSTGNELVAAVDKHDSVGILDQYFPDTHFFTEFERFDRHVEKLKRQGNPVDFMSICSPNYLHDAHIRYALRVGADVICEKPVVLNPWNIDALMEMEQETGKKVFTILQLRLHPSIVALRQNVMSAPADKKFTIDLNYIAARGHWYANSWKGEIAKSGGITTNLGIHFFDMLIWIFGNVIHSHVLQLDDQNASGELELERAFVKWRLSTDVHHLPQSTLDAGLRTFRNLEIDGQTFDFSTGMETLHNACYDSILLGNGFRLAETRASIDLAYQIRNAQLK